jgi:hypothetical protein
MKKSPLPIPRRSFRIDEIAARNSFSVGFIYKQINLGLLRVRKAGSATIITIEDETAWLDAMPHVLSEPTQLSTSRAERRSHESGDDDDQHDSL